MTARPLKIAGGVVVVAILAYGGASWYAGRLAQQNIKAWVHQTNQSIAAQWGDKTPAPALRVQSYHRGLFSSEIEYQLSYRDERGTAHELGLHDALQHGPWPWAALHDGNWQPLAAYSRVTPVAGGDWQPWMQAMPPGVPPWVARTRIGFAGDVSTQLQVAPVKAGGLDFSGGSLQVHYQPKADQTVLAARFRQLSLQDASSGATLTLEGFEAQAQSRGSQAEDRQAHQQITLDKLDLVPQGKAPVSLQQQALKVDVAQTGGLMDVQLNYGAGHLLFAARDLGHLSALASAQNLSVPALQALSQTVARIDAAHAPGDKLSAPEQQQIRTGVLPILAASPQLSVQSLRWANDKGTSEIKAQAGFRPVPDNAAPADLGATIEQGIRAVSLRLQLSKPMVLQFVRQSQIGPNADMTAALVSMVFDQYAGRLERAGLVKQTSDGLVQADLSYADGQVTVNGVPMTPSQLADRFAGLLGGTF